MPNPSGPDSVALDTAQPIWDRVFTVAPLVLVGTRDADGSADFAPKHMVSPMGWQNYFGFVCTPRHATYRNIQRDGVFTVSYVKPSQLLFASLAASPRCDDGSKLVLESYSTFPASRVDADCITEAYLHLECELYKVVDGFGSNSLITGEIVAAAVDPAYQRASEFDDQELIHDAPLFAYLSPGRFATITRSASFPFPAGMKR